MAKTWIVHRFRSALVSENLSLIVLGLLRDSERSEWEILNLMDSRYGFNPSPKDFHKLLKSFTVHCYTSQEFVEGICRLRITEGGMELLRRLELEYREIVLSINESTVPAPDLP